MWAERPGPRRQRGLARRGAAVGWAKARQVADAAATSLLQQERSKIKVRKAWRLVA